MNKPAQGIHNTTPTNDRPKFSGDYQSCGKKGHKQLECYGKKRDEAKRNHKTSDTNRHSKSDLNTTPIWCATHVDTPVIQNETAHTTESASALRNVPYDQQTMDENMKFRKYFKSSHKRAPLNEVPEQPKLSKSSESEEGQSLNRSRHITHSKKAKVRSMSYLKNRKRKKQTKNTKGDSEPHGCRQPPRDLNASTKK